MLVDIDICINLMLVKGGEVLCACFVIGLLSLMFCTRLLIIPLHFSHGRAGDDKLVSIW